MPKLRKRVKKGQVIKKSNVLRKFRIGNRKTGDSAEQMNTEDLIAVLANESKSKYHRNAASVLKTRTINI